VYDETLACEVLGNRIDCIVAQVASGVPWGERLDAASCAVEEHSVKDPGARGVGLCVEGGLCQGLKKATSERGV